MNLITGIDIGNAKTEVAFVENGNEILLRQPSVIAEILSKPDGNDNEEKSNVEHLLDNLVVQIFSEGLDRAGMYFVGNKALQAPQNIKNMNITIGGKSEEDLPMITSLSLLAGIAIKKYYRSKGSLPKTLSVNVDLATAIPSSEYSKKSAKMLEDRFKNLHKVNVYVGDKEVLVNINVERCKVTEEGKTSMMAFLNSDNDILRHYNETYNENATVRDFEDAPSLHGDIGDGTSEFVYTKGYNPVPNGSFGERVGVGHATNDAIRLYRKEITLVGEITRQHYMDLLKDKGEKSKIANEMMKRATGIQASKIIDQFKYGFMTYTASTAQYLFVHGGGSVVFKDDMYKPLIKLADQIKAQVVWIPEEYATSMNSRGTLYLAQLLFGEDSE
ncbi:ParM/StbA family protein [Terribacillus saccharophilus]|uniref:ParM/StbA family protein n=1 Tax=Terribacillus saccharophilus TaxID=361277 RepID=UPI002989FCD9|nr:ParM/StbA family protein [Terribacillus saccharophilus]MCM3227566.1 ParM/StbA family protein [Terribacillus saccharophilus]